MRIETVRPDAKGRVYLGDLAKGVSSYSVEVDEMGKITLEPRVEIPAKEMWLFKNTSAIDSVKRGLEDILGGKLSDLDDLSQYLDD